MRVIVLALLALANLGMLAAISASIDGTPAIEADIPSVPRPASVLGARLEPADPEPDLSPGRTMFGTRAAEAQPVPQPRPASSNADPHEMRLVGVLIAQGGDGRRSTVILLRHGSPPFIGHYPVGGVVDGWHLDAATRSSVELVKEDGTKLFLQLDKTSKTQNLP